MNEQPTFITGLPRCRSAWFAAFLSHGGSLFLHDAFHGITEFEDFPKLFTEHPKASGSCDPANVFYWERIVQWFPKSKWVVIERPFEEVVKSCQKIWPIERPALWAMADKLSDLIEAVNPLIVDFHSITPEVALKVADYCGVDTGGLHRTELICRMNIQLEPSFLKDALLKLKDSPPKWMSKE